MTKFNWSNFPIIPGFDVLKWKRENQDRILRETAGMTKEEVRERLRKAVDRADHRRAEFVERQATENQM
jgi:hypothetical protein